MAMKLSTGKIGFPIYFDNGDVETVYINPYDNGLQERIRNFETSIKGRVKKINFEKYKDTFGSGFDVSSLDFNKLVEMSEEELKMFENQTEVLNAIDKEIEKELCEEIDNIFQSDVSSKAFKYVPPLAMIPTDENGKGCEMYIVLVLQALATEVQKYGKKMNKATEKYTSKYKKNR